MASFETSFIIKPKKCNASLPKLRFFLFASTFAGYCRKAWVIKIVMDDSKGNVHSVRTASAIENNPFKCDCQLVAFLNFAESRNLKLNYFTYPKPSCKSPLDFKGTLLTDRRLQEMVCDSVSTTSSDLNTTSAVTKYPDADSSSTVTDASTTHQEITTTGTDAITTHPEITTTGTYAITTTDTGSTKVSTGVTGPDSITSSTDADTVFSELTGSGKKQKKKTNRTVKDDTAELIAIQREKLDMMIAIQREMLEMMRKMHKTFEEFVASKNKN